ncbi:ATP-dependent RecD-like DNA helicase [Methylocella sp.]|uniref:ATP-dependent RecD-like DNA helicase n=1 Tax=Methylocella sp. TaxID=1978226 RepID=UPI0037842091
MSFSPQQDRALKEVSAWLSRREWETRREAQVFRLFGYAGAGKTTLARRIAEDVDGETLFAAFTGKAALMLRSRGCRGARTIHSLIYRPRESEVETEAPTFVLNEDSALAAASLVVVDECSMVDEALGRDLLSFGRPVLVLGDPAQLPPVRGGGFFTEAEPDVMLTEIHRQAADNPIIRLSMLARDGGRLTPGDYGEAKVVTRDKIDAAAVTASDQVLVGVNRTRRAYNRRLRELFGFSSDLPEAGDRLVCLRNDSSKGLLNGGVWTVRTVGAMRRKKLTLHVAPDDEPARKPLRVSVAPEFFQGTEDSLTPQQRRESDEFDYGYALTVHKAQGSQWPDVTLFDESGAFREHRSRWLYTGVTRAAERLTVVI